MENNLISPKTIATCIFCSLLLSSAMAMESENDVLKIILPKNITEDTLEKKLNQMGIILDENSAIFIHEEENYINLDCFNCIVRSIGSQIALHGPFNERPTK